MLQGNFEACTFLKELVQRATIETVSTYRFYSRLPARAIIVKIIEKDCKQTGP